MWHWLSCKVTCIWKDSCFVFRAQKNCSFTTAQVSVYNCTKCFTTAQSVHNCTLKIPSVETTVCNITIIVFNASARQLLKDLGRRAAISKVCYSESYIGLALGRGFERWGYMVKYKVGKLQCAIYYWILGLSDLQIRADLNKCYLYRIYVLLGPQKHASSFLLSL